MPGAKSAGIVTVTSKKPVVSGAFSEHGVPRMADMMQLFRSDRSDLIAKPMSIFTITATGNFRYGEDSCQNLLDCVEAGIPIEIVPVTLMRHHLRRFPDEYISSQHYMAPYPEELMLRNSI